MWMTTKVSLYANYCLLHLQENPSISGNTLQAHLSQPIQQFDTLPIIINS